MGIIVAGHTGIGKTHISQQYPDKILDLIPTPFKYDIQPETICSEATKASHGWDVAEDWPENYVKKIKEVWDSHEFIMIAPDIFVLEMLRRNGIPYILAYPERSCKEEYKTRFIQRGNSDKFMEIFIDGWDRFMESYENTYCTHRLVLKHGEFLTLKKLHGTAAAFPAARIDFNAVYTVTRDELAEKLDRILDMVEIGYSPILIKTNDKPDLLLFGWADYMERFGALYSKEEIDLMEEACKNHRKDEAK